MNIFVIEKDPHKAAIQLPDKLICKMPLETAQMLSTAHRYHSPHEYCVDMSLYKKAYYNHPCTVWARESHENYRWLLLHWISLCEEFYYRYGKYHLSWTQLQEGLLRFPMNIREGTMTSHPQCMPAIYKKPNDAVSAYRDYVIHEKHYAAWNKGRDKPNWWTMTTH